LQRIVIGTVKELALQTHLSQPTVTAALERLIDLEIVKASEGKRRGRYFGYSQYLKILGEGTESSKD
ncbi:MAG TPA: helix-turn-helix domain-containing protein, partial [bacterium]